MFDWFIPKKSVPCPSCKKITIEEEFKRQAFQGKALRCSLDRIKEGQKIILNSEDSKLWIDKGWIEAYDYCDNCGKLFYVRLLVKNGRWKGWKYAKKQE